MYGVAYAHMKKAKWTTSRKKGLSKYKYSARKMQRKKKLL